MSQLIPEDLPKGKEVVQEGIRIGNTFEVGKSAFHRYRNVHSENEFRRMQAEKGIIQWNPQVGLSTVEEQVEGLRYLWEWGKSKGVEINRALTIGSMLNGLPPELRSKAPKPTSFVFENPEDFVKIAEAAPIAFCTGDNMIGSPNSVNNAIDTLKAGANEVGTVSQHIWDFPYFHDDVAQMIEMVKAVGIMASKRKDGATVASYTGDGLPGQLFDNVSAVGYMLFEKYVVERLCGAAYCSVVGGLHSYIPAKLATWLALYDLLSQDHHSSYCPVPFLEGNTVEVSEDVKTNYALVVSEFIPFAILERKYKTGTSYLAKPVTEAIRVPTLDEIIEVFSVCLVALRKALEYEEARMLNESHINELRSIIATNARKFFNNMLKGLSEMGIDTSDPLQLLLSTRRLGGRRVEELFHPGEKDPSLPRGIVPFVPTDLSIRSMKKLDEVLERVRTEKLGDAVKGKKIIVGSTDTHEYGLFVLVGVLRALDAKVIDKGVDLDPEQVLDAAFEEGMPYIAISTHNGQCLDWGRRLMEVAKARNQNVKVAIGGTLNAMLEGDTEPVDVSDRLSDLGIMPCHEAIDLIKGISPL